MVDLLKDLSGNYMPHGGCFLWNPELLWTHVVSDAVIGLSYFSIPLTLAVLVRKRRDLVFSWVFLMFASFIFFCGATHFMEIWTMWDPYYWTEGTVKIGTAVVSAWTAIAIWFLLPRAVELPGPGELRSEIKEREQAQKKLNREKAKVESMIDSMPGVFYVFDENGNILEWNDELSRVTGYSGEEIQGMSPADFVPETDRDEVASVMSNVFDNESHESVESALVTRDGREIPYQFTGAPLYDENDELIGLVGSGQDISRLNEREQQLRKTRGELRELNEQLEEKVELRTRELEQFVYAASHDLREPARIVRTYAQFLEEDLGEDLDEKIEEDLGYLVDASDRMTNLIDSLLKLSRAGNQEITIESISLEEVTDEALGNLEQRIEEASATIRKNELPEVEADRTLITDLYQNLISNAVKYSGESPPEVTLTAEKTENAWVLGVRDQGIGIDPDNQEKIFEPFTYYSEGTEHEGTGIGLSICRKIVERHNGDLWVESEPGQGAHFKFTLKPEEG